MNNLKLKIFYNEKKTFLCIPVAPIKYEILKQDVARYLGVKIEKVEEGFEYTDIENDLILISNEVDYQQALEHIVNSGSMELNLNLKKNEAKAKKEELTKFPRGQTSKKDIESIIEKISQEKVANIYEEIDSKSSTIAVRGDKVNKEKITKYRQDKEANNIEKANKKMEMTKEIKKSKEKKEPNDKKESKGKESKEKKEAKEKKKKTEIKESNEKKETKEVKEKKEIPKNIETDKKHEKKPKSDKESKSEKSNHAKNSNGLQNKQDNKKKQVRTELEQMKNKAYQKINLLIKLKFDLIRKEITKQAFKKASKQIDEEYVKILADRAEKKKELESKIVNPDILTVEQAEVLHPRVICDGCQKKITGIRYKCTVCEDFDYCHNCENENSEVHNHTFIKIRLPQIAPKKILCVIPEEVEKAYPKFTEIKNPFNGISIKGTNSLSSKKDLKAEINGFLNDCLENNNNVSNAQDTEANAQTLANDNDKEDKTDANIYSFEEIDLKKFSQQMNKAKIDEEAKNKEVKESNLSSLAKVKSYTVTTKENQETKQSIVLINNGTINWTSPLKFKCTNPSETGNLYEARINLNIQPGEVIKMIIVLESSKIGTNTSYWQMHDSHNVAFGDVVEIITSVEEEFIDINKFSEPLEIIDKDYSKQISEMRNLFDLGSLINDEQLKKALVKANGKLDDAIAFIFDESMLY